MADVIGKMDENHEVSDIDGVIDEVAAARGEYEDLNARLEAIEALLSNSNS